MSTWPSNPTWASGDNINNGNQYEPYDGVIASDINKIVTDILYLYLNSATKETLDAKLDKVTASGSGRSYCVDSQGNQVMRTYSGKSISGGTLLYRESSSNPALDGDCQVRDPINPYSIANRRWVEAQITSALGTINTALEAI